ncbi:DUF1800 domain-containing protein [Pseudoduganella violaceinigra]|uniref:DUF1800 domain-containing protein n=1 Tax=Pseudoduganella violaceinigra TaxID=246602 RepID=UPI0004828E51|nr:DUF1800 domain-containing protein [Pseudoduganella violaceinigra]
MRRWMLAAVIATLPQAAVWAAPLSGEQAAVHVLNRLAYGPRPGDIERVRQAGVAAYIDEQLNPPPLPPALAQRLDKLETLKMSAGDALQRFQDARQGEQGERREVVQQLAAEAAEARLLRAVESPRQLEEVMVDFWYNHFNVFAGKGQDRALVASYERDAIRPYVFGSFRQMLGATAHHPAMLFYLDNWVSKAGGLNENYARELMELHTLGVDGGYTQKDVTELARMLTGWTYRPKRDAQFAFDPRRHDTGSKTWLGKTVGARGAAEGEYALDVLAVHPSTARNISRKLAQYFVADQPPPALVERMAQTWIGSNGDIRSVLRTLFSSPEFMDQQYAGAKFKTPYQFVVSASRASAMPVADVKPLVGILSRLGQPLYGCQTPDGYKNTESAWLNPDGLSRRISYAMSLSSGADAATVQDALGASVSKNTASIVAGSNERLRAAMLLGSPDFMQH